MDPASSDRVLPGRRALWTAGLAAFAGAFGLYLLTLAPGLPVGHDSGEFITAATVLGIPHPPGYPLWTLLGYGFAQLPVGSVPFRLNLMSAFAVALAVGLSAVTFSRLSGRLGAGTMAALAFGMALAPWRLGVAAEKYGLHLALLAGILFAAPFWRDADGRGRCRWLVVLSLLVGLSLAHHHTVVLVLPGLALFMLWSRNGRPWGISFAAPAALLAGLLPYAYLPLRASQDPPLNWGDPSNWDRFLWVVLRKGYEAQLNVDQGQGDAGTCLWAFLQSMAWDQFPLGLVVLGLVGIGWGLSRGLRAEVALCGGLWLLQGPVFSLIASQPAQPEYLDLLERLYAAAYLGFAGLIALGIRALEERLAPVPVRVMVALLLVGTFWLHLPRVDQSGDYVVEDTQQAVFDAVPPDALLVAGTDQMSGAALYYQVVLGRRPDVQMLFPGLLGSDWYRGQLPEGLRDRNLDQIVTEARAQGRDVYFDYLPSDLPGFFVPRGLVYRYLAPGEPLPDREVVDRQVFAFLEAQSRRGDYQHRSGDSALRAGLLGRWADAYRTVAESLPYEQARMALGRAVALDEQARDHLQLGRLHLAHGAPETAELALLKAAELRPEDPAVAAALADLYDSQGRSEEALRWRH